ncbi:hypothetical protein FA13DRAFT_1318329 [Coprinellus micaceus]|uniref:Uncharacterized protein n=1 Tax=Coprinellus micaceus TaxID=71717 RepID=A0A4Y7SRC1_COPMI|nr:hypothetical protein FA13DRAFT_1318329 [Coprinellus micaceus]
MTKHHSSSEAESPLSRRRWPTLECGSRPGSFEQPRLLCRGWMEYDLDDLACRCRPWLSIDSAPVPTSVVSCISHTHSRAPVPLPIAAHHRRPCWVSPGMGSVGWGVSNSTPSPDSDARLRLGSASVCPVCGYQPPEGGSRSN